MRKVTKKEKKLQRGVTAAVARSLQKGTRKTFPYVGEDPVYLKIPETKSFIKKSPGVPYVNTTLRA